jgi:SAM-dependent methyltransferase
MLCQGAGCRASFPIFQGVPVLLNDERSLFSAEEVVAGARNKSSSGSPNKSARAALQKIIPGISRNVSGHRNFAKFAQHLLEESKAPKVLVVGGKSIGEGFDQVLSRVPPIDIVETDVVFGARTMVLCDGHDLPFADGVFDGVVIQAVLEHVVDPHRCVEEIYRVMRPAGIVYAETPFIQQVHEGRFDFTRFTHLGHRRLFRRFSEIESGAACGTGMALAWSYRYFLLSLSDSPLIRNLMDTLAKLTSFPLKYFDSMTLEKGGSFDAASAYYFLGRKSDVMLSDRDLIRSYRGRI